MMQNSFNRSSVTEEGTQLQTVGDFDGMMSNELKNK